MLDLRPLQNANRTEALTDALTESIYRFEILGSYVVLLDFARMITLNPLAIHLVVSYFKGLMVRLGPILSECKTAPVHHLSVESYSADRGNVGCSRIQ